MKSEPSNGSSAAGGGPSRQEKEAVEGSGSRRPSLISIVIPCYNEGPVLDQLYSELTRVAGSWSWDYSVVLVDDGSDEETWEKLREIHAKDSRWNVLRLARNFGHQNAVSAGLEYARGDAVVVLDADLQDPPTVVNRFLAEWENGTDVVYGVRRRRKENWIKRSAYFLFYRILGRLSEVEIPSDSGDFCLMDRRVVDHLVAMPERHRFLRGLRAWSGFRQKGIEYERAARHAGTPQYTLGKLVKLASDGIFAFSTSPLRLATRLGLAVSIFAFLGTVFTFVSRLLKIIFPDSFDRLGMPFVQGFTTTVMSVLFLGGVQLICIGIMGEYIGRIYDEVKRRPNWIVAETLGANEGESNEGRAPKS